MNTEEDFCRLNSVYKGVLQPLLSILDHINKGVHCPCTLYIEIHTEKKCINLLHTGFLLLQLYIERSSAVFIVYFRLYS